MTRLTTDLATCLGCRWVVAMTTFENDLLPLFCYGEHPELELCISHVQSVVNRREYAEASRYWYEPQHCDADIGLPVAIVCVMLGGQPCILAVGGKNDGSCFCADDHALISEFASHASNMARDDRFARIVAGRIASSLNTEAELESAREVENRMFPQVLAPVDGLDYYGECQPVGGVGGDFFDLVPGSLARGEPSSLTVSIGDVSGKGVPAAIITAGLQASLRALVPMRQKLSALIRSMNRLVWDLSPTGFFTTMFFGKFDLARRELHYVNAGHQAPLLIRAKHDRLLRLDPSGSVLGLTAASNFGQRTVALQPGDLFLALTDGVSGIGEISDSFERSVLDIVRENRSSTSLELARKILAHAPRSLSFGAPDDKTVVVVRIKGVEEAEFVPARRELCAVAVAA